LNSILRALADDADSGGIGPALPLLLAVILAAGVGYWLLRRRSALARSQRDPGSY
jgi:hypothetical protein